MSFPRIGLWPYHSYRNEGSDSEEEAQDETDGWDEELDEERGIAENPAGISP